MSDFEHSSFRLQVVEDLRVHLHLKTICLLEDRVQTVIEHASRLLGLRKPLTQALILVKDRGKNHQVHTILQDLGQKAPSINVSITTNWLHSAIENVLVDLGEVLDILDRLL